MKRLTAIALLLTVATGCGNNTRNEASPSPDRYSVRTEQTVPAKPRMTNKESVAVHLEKLATSVPGVNGANCVVVGNTAVVGIDVDGKLDRSRVGTIKYSVAEAFHKDPYGIHAVVTADMDLASRIADIRADMRRGRVIKGFAEEMADIIGRIAPQLPGDVLQQNEPLEKQNEDQKKLKHKNL